jgi:hypothetical protein
MRNEIVSKLDTIAGPARCRRNLVGSPLQPKHVWAVRTRLQLFWRSRDLALFDLAIDRRRRGCGLVNHRVRDVAPHGDFLARATVRQRKTRRPVRFEITKQTRQALGEYLRTGDKSAGGCLQQAEWEERSALHSAIRPLALEVDRQCRARPVALWDAFPAPH